MSYWKRIELKNIDVIIEKSLEFLKIHTPYMMKESFKGAFISLAPYQFLQKIPEITESLQEHGLFVEDANIYVMWNNKDSVVHKDYTDSIGRINIPLLNCEGTYTTFYENVHSRRLVLPTSAPFYMTTNKDYIEVDRVEIIQPTIIKVCDGHNVIMDETRVPRITLTLTCTPDAGLLLDD
jgi:hypothetical protein